MLGFFLPPVVLNLAAAAPSSSSPGSAAGVFFLGLPAMLNLETPGSGPGPGPGTGTGPTYFTASVAPRDVPASPDVPSFASVRVEPA